MACSAVSSVNQRSSRRSKVLSAGKEGTDAASPNIISTEPYWRSASVGSSQRGGDRAREGTAAASSCIQSARPNWGSRGTETCHGGAGNVCHGIRSERNGLHETTVKG